MHKKYKSTMAKNNKNIYWNLSSLPKFIFDIFHIFFKSFINRILNMDINFQLLLSNVLNMHKIFLKTFWIEWFVSLKNLPSMCCQFQEKFSLILRISYLLHQVLFYQFFNNLRTCARGFFWCDSQFRNRAFLVPTNILDNVSFCLIQKLTTDTVWNRVILKAKSYPASNDAIAFKKSLYFFPRFIFSIILLDFNLL